MLVTKKVVAAQLIAVAVFLYCCYRAGRAIGPFNHPHEDQHVANKAGLSSQRNADILLYEELEVLRETPKQSNSLKELIEENDHTAPLVDEIFRHDAWMDARDDLCQSKPPTLLVLVTSAPANREARVAIRRSWGQHAKSKNGVVLVFVLGSTPHDQLLEVKRNGRFRF